MREHLACGCKPGALCRIGQVLLELAEQAKELDAQTPYDTPEKPHTNHLYLQARGRFIEHIEKGETTK